MSSGYEDNRKEPMVVDIDMLVPKNHLLRKVEKVMDYDWLCGANMKGKKILQRHIWQEYIEIAEATLSGTTP